MTYLEETSSDTGAMLFAISISVIVLAALFIPFVITYALLTLGEKTRLFLK